MFCLGSLTVTTDTTRPFALFGKIFLVEFFVAVLAKAERLVFLDSALVAVVLSLESGFGIVATVLAEDDDVVVF